MKNSATMLVYKQRNFCLKNTLVVAMREMGVNFHRDFFSFLALRFLTVTTDCRKYLRIGLPLTKGDAV